MIGGGPNLNNQNNEKIIQYQRREMDILRSYGITK